MALNIPQDVVRPTVARHLSSGDGPKWLSCGSNAVNDNNSTQTGRTWHSRSTWPAYGVRPHFPLAHVHGPVGRYIPFACYCPHCAPGTIPEFQQHELLGVGSGFEPMTRCLAGSGSARANFPPLCAGVRKRLCLLVFVSSVVPRIVSRHPLWLPSWLSISKKGHSPCGE